MQLNYFVKVNPEGQITAITYDLMKGNESIVNVDFEIGEEKQQDTFTLNYALEVFSACFSKNLKACPINSDHYMIVKNAFEYIKNGKELEKKFEYMHGQVLEDQNHISVDV